MPADGSPAETLTPWREPRGLASASASTVLGICDKVVGEAGRRAHPFGWLRVPGAEAGQWLTVDAYYPVNRLVVLCRTEPEPHDRMIRDLMPQHGLRLLELDPTALGGRRELVEASIARLLAGLGPAPVPIRRPPVAAVPTTAARPSQTASGETTVPLGLLLGVALVAAGFIEVFVGVTEFGLDGGHLLVAAGLALDVCARTLGTVAACQAGSPGWAWACAIGGSPLVLSFAYLQADGPVTVDPAPAAGRVATAAGVVIALAIAVAVLGS